MRILHRSFKFLLFTLLLLIIALVAFIIWNHYPPLPSRALLGIHKITVPHEKEVGPSFTVATYNIQYGIGFQGNRLDGLERRDFYERLQRLADILIEIDADIVLLQEVDFYARKSQFIDQASFLAEKAGYPYFAEAPHWRRRFFPYWNRVWGPLNHGLCILSRFPLLENEARVFEHPKEAPFYVRWLYSPHGGQRAVAQIGTQKVALFNVHLEPWAQKTREKSVEYIKEWMAPVSTPLILGGDFNAIPPEAPVKTFYNLEDTPWFIDRREWNVENDTTIRSIRELGFSEATPPKEYLANEHAAFTYPADKPSQKLDYLFAGKGAVITKGWVFTKAGDASDHLPLVAEVKLSSENLEK